PGFGHCAVLENLDEDHAPAATRTRGGWRWLSGHRVLHWSWLFGGTEQGSGLCEILNAVSISEQSIVPDAVKAIGQDVQEESADELVHVECHDAVAGFAITPVILPFEADAGAIEGDEA